MKEVFVDGYKIRQTLDPDFNIIGIGGFDPLQVNRRWYIPKGELWFDGRFVKEKKFLLAVESAPTPKIRIKHRFVDQARHSANKRFIQKGTPPPFTMKTKKQWGVALRYVNGSVVRQYLDPEFVFGGHGYVYSYIPKNEVWLDALMDPCDLSHVLCHERVERDLMKRQKKSYTIAHEYATVAEKEGRRKRGGRYPGDSNFPSSWTHSFLLEYYRKQHSCAHETR
jgi:hypothetical protein